MTPVQRLFSRIPSFRGGLLLACVLAFGSGCTSIVSTMVTRDETNQTWERHDCLNGIPITLKVPTHLKVYVYHKHYLEPVLNDVRDTVGYKAANVGVVVRDFSHELMYTEKVFVVDFKRPPAGSSNLRVDMTEKQYLAEIQHDVTDTTIAQVGALIGEFAGLPPQQPGGAKSAGAPPSRFRPQLIPLRSLVAVGIFEIEAPDFEQQLKQFISCHVNQAHDAWVVPPGISGINRAAIVGNLETPYGPIPVCPPNQAHPLAVIPTEPIEPTQPPHDQPAGQLGGR